MFPYILEKAYYPSLNPQAHFSWPVLLFPYCIAHTEPSNGHLTGICLAHTYGGKWCHCVITSSLWRELEWWSLRCKLRCFSIVALWLKNKTMTSISVHTGQTPLFYCHPSLLICRAGVLDFNFMNVTWSVSWSTDCLFRNHALRITSPEK